MMEKLAVEEEVDGTWGRRGAFLK